LRKNFGAAFPRGRNIVFRKVDFLNTIAPPNLRGYWTKVHQTLFVSLNATGNAVVNQVFRF